MMQELRYIDGDNKSDVERGVRSRRQLLSFQRKLAGEIYAARFPFFSAMRKSDAKKAARSHLVRNVNKHCKSYAILTAQKNPLTSPKAKSKRKKTPLPLPKQTDTAETKIAPA